MTAKSTDRKGKKAASGVSETEAALASFKLPESLPTSKVDFPVLIKRRKKASWHQIVHDAEHFQQEIEVFEGRNVQKTPLTRDPFINTEYEYIQNEVLICLVPALIETLNKAKIWNAFEHPKCFFNGIDHIVQVLWNTNPRWQHRHQDNLHVFNMPWVRKHLQLYPRRYYPKSWLWPEEYAATYIQKTVRRYFVQREDDVQEMREFWRKLDLEREHPSLLDNPFSARHFASATRRPKHEPPPPPQEQKHHK